MAQEIKRLSDGSETWTSATVCSAAEIEYLVLNPTSKSAAIAGVIAAAPTSYGDNQLPFKEVRFNGWENGNINCTAVYAEADSGGGGGSDDDSTEATESFDCGGGTKHMTHAINQSRVYGGSGDDAGGGIGWNGKSGSEAEFSGVDVPTADMRETYTKTISKSKATSTSYKKTVASLVGKVNSGSFKGWAAGEVMFLGCSYSTPSRGSSKVTVSYNFRIMPNESSCKVAGKNCGSKHGFEYMWARSETVQGTDGKPAVEVKAIYKSTVCESGNFGGLGL